MVKDKELLTLQEDNRLLAKQFRQKKDAQKKREKLLQVRILTRATQCYCIMYVL